jgi:hypothetical protein
MNGSSRKAKIFLSLLLAPPLIICLSYIVVLIIFRADYHRCMKRLADNVQVAPESREFYRAMYNLVSKDLVRGMSHAEVQAVLMRIGPVEITPGTAGNYPYEVAEFKLCNYSINNLRFEIYYTPRGEFDFIRFADAS